LNNKKHLTPLPPFPERAGGRVPSHLPKMAGDSRGGIKLLSPFRRGGEVRKI